MVTNYTFIKVNWSVIVLPTLFLLFFGCSHFSNDEKMIISTATYIRLKIELGEKPQSAKEEWLTKIQKGGTSLEKLQTLLSEDWKIKFEKYGKADDSDHKAAGCMHVYGDCILKRDEETAYATLKFYFPSQEMDKQANRFCPQ